MTNKKLACVILAAGQGSRMKSDLPKAMHKLAGLPMINWLINTVEKLSPEKIIVVTSPKGQAVADAVHPHKIVVQEKALGTADAVKAALPELDDFDGDVLILLADTPFLSVGVITGLLETRRSGGDTGISVLGIQFDGDPPPYGRLVMGYDEDNSLERIIEDRDCTPEQRSIKLCNTGAFCVDGARLKGWLDQVGNNNAQKEYYITDLPEIAADEGIKTRIAILYDEGEMLGVNCRADLAALEKMVQQKLRKQAMDNGVTMIDPESVYLSWDTKTGRDVLIEPSVFFGEGVTVGDGVHIKAFTHMEGAVIENAATIGPHARLRPGTEIGEGARIGNFVEVKNAKVGAGVKAGHLAYIGDAEIGAGTNFSCGAITVNYDGTNKHKTIIGENAMIGSDVCLVAPVEIGSGAYVAAGSTITKNVPADALAVAREKPRIIEGWAANKK